MVQIKVTSGKAEALKGEVAVSEDCGGSHNVTRPVPRRGRGTKEGGREGKKEEKAARPVSPAPAIQFLWGQCFPQSGSQATSVRFLDGH